MAEVRYQVVHILDSDGKAQQGRVHDTVRALNRSPMLDQALDASERGRWQEHAGACGDPLGRIGISGDTNRHYRTETRLHLFPGNPVGRMICQPWIEDAGDPRISLEMLGEALGVLASGSEAERQCSQAAQREPAGERIQDPAGQLANSPGFLLMYFVRE